MKKTFVTVVVALGLLAGCGSGSGSDEPQPAATTPAPPPTYTPRQLADALPTKDDVPGAGKVIAACPDKKDACSSAEGILADRSVSFDIAPIREPSLAEQERAEALPVISEFALVSAKLFSTADQAAAVTEQARKANAEYDGTFESKAKRLAGSSYEPGIVGTGRVEEVSIGGFDGMFSARQLALTDPDGQKGPMVLDVFISVHRGTSEVQGSAALLAEGRDPDAALDLVKQQVSDYLDRLEKS